MSARRLSPHPIAWFRDHHARGLLNLTPPYQRRSVWSQSFKDYFIDTVLLGYPAPPVYLFEEISPDGVTAYNVVDGKQRISTVLKFVDDRFPVSDAATNQQLHGIYFSSLPDDVKDAFWRYTFNVEFLPSSDSALLQDIFDRLNRNVARLTRQELRHARFSGEFAKRADAAATLVGDILPQGFPNIAAASKRQMKDVEVAAQLLLLAKEGPSTFSQDDLDDIYSEYDETWDGRKRAEARLRAALGFISELAEAGDRALTGSRLKNQADFYSLVGAVLEVIDAGPPPSPEVSATRLLDFVEKVGSEKDRADDEVASAYYDAVRSASNDARQRVMRIGVLKAVVLGD